MPLLDAHLHLSDARFAGLTGEVLARARAAGVGRFVSCAANENEWRPLLDLADREPDVIPFLGIHPWYAGETSPGWRERLLQTLDTNRAGVGEIGLDRLSGPAAAIQEEVFLSQLTLAVELRRPVTIHCVRRWGRLLELTRGFDLAASGWLAHAFGGSGEIMRELVGKGAFLSFPPWIANPSAEKMRAVFRQTPLDRILLETDCPDSAKSEPESIPALYHYCAGLKNMDPMDFANTVWENGRQIFAD